jgi:hypothetical protein
MMNDQLYELKIPDLPFTVTIETFWFSCNGWRWDYLSSISINEIDIAGYSTSQIFVRDLELSIQLSGLGISKADSRMTAKFISSFILNKAKETCP